MVKQFHMKGIVEISLELAVRLFPSEKSKRLMLVFDEKDLTQGADTEVGMLLHALTASGLSQLG